MIRKLTTKLKRILIPIERMLSVIRRDRLTVYAGQASYFVLMSSVPLVMLLVSLFGAIYPLDGDAILALTAEILPEQLRDFGGKLLSGVGFFKSAGSLNLFCRDGDTSCLRFLFTQRSV